MVLAVTVSIHGALLKGPRWLGGSIAYKNSLHTINTREKFDYYNKKP
jgi:hypothetical protein